MSVARNALVDYARKKKEVHIDDNRMIDFNDVTDEKARLVESISECLYELINEYDKDERELLLSVFTTSMTRKEMARYLDIPYSTLKSRIQKARNQILQDFRSRCCTLQRNSKGEIIGCILVEEPALAEC
jgi:RNA polymerase sigma-70 factor (ECF subfamily)